MIKGHVGYQGFPGRSLYGCKWEIFEGCAIKQTSALFPQDSNEKSRALLAVKIFLVGIPACHVGLEETEVN